MWPRSCSTWVMRGASCTTTPHRQQCCRLQCVAKGNANHRVQGNGLGGESESSHSSEGGKSRCLYAHATCPMTGNRRSG
eukprot:6346447-Lingulodinium_polyedra.AAC.1